MIPDADIARAVAVLRDGGLAAFPTETVYGLGADARNPEAVRRIYALKGRPATHPLIVHIAGAADLAAWARDIPSAAQALAARFWPGPLTLVLKRAPGVDDSVTGGQDTVALRAPAHPVARALLRAFGGGIAAPSANRYGSLSPTSAEHVRAEFGAELACVLDGGASEVGVESTILDLSGTRPAVLRPGRITASELEAVLGTPLAAADEDSPRAPGGEAQHYAPRTPLALVEPARLAERTLDLLARGRKVAVLAREVPRPTLAKELAWISAPPDAAGYAHELYADLRRLDAARGHILLVEVPPQGEAWAAVHDRLGRAASARV